MCFMSEKKGSNGKVTEAKFGCTTKSECANQGWIENCVQKGDRKLCQRCHADLKFAECGTGKQ